MNTVTDADTLAIAQLGARVRGRLEADPFVQTVSAEKVEMFGVTGFLSAGECNRLIAMIDRFAEPSRVFDPDNPVKYRTSYSSDIDMTDPLVRAIDDRICGALGIDPSWGENLQGQRYLPGQEFHSHYDWFQTESDYWPQEQARGGQRSWTAMIYLTNEEEGGRTVFPNLGIAIPPQQGMLLMWNNALPNGLPNEDALHAALPVVRGKKYIITKWFRARRWG